MDDLISRQAAIETIQRAFDRETLLYSFVRKVAVDALKTMPSAQPEQKKGKWIDARDHCGEFLCSNCHETNINNFYNYCPHCGAKMEAVDA